METDKKSVLGIIAFCVGSILIIFTFTGFFNDKVDTEDYVDQIIQFEEGTFFNPNFAIANRIFKPFYGFTGSIITSFGTSHYLAILIINIFFLIGLSIATYYFLRLINFNRQLSFWGSVWVALAYPVLKYGIALGTDIGGWFFALVTIVFFLRFIKTENYNYLFIASLLGFIGGLTKETGILGLIFGGLYILFQINYWPFKKVLRSMLTLALPSILLESLYLFYLYTLKIPGFFDWYKENVENYGESYYKLHYFIGIEGSTFNFLLLLSLIGILLAIKNKDFLKRNFLSIYVSLFIAILPILLWPVFISRVIFIQFLFFVPMSLYAISNLDENILKKKIMKIEVRDWMIIAPPVFSLLLFLIARDRSLFDVLLALPPYQK